MPKRLIPHPVSKAHPIRNVSLAKLIKVFQGTNKYVVKHIFR